MTITEIKKTTIEFSNEEKEILQKAGNILDELYKIDTESSILYDILENSWHDLADFDDISFVLNCLCEKNSFCID